MTPLGQLFKKHGSDKHEHGYDAVYATLPAPARLLEVGVYKGASLRAWREWWPGCSIAGLDNFDRGVPHHSLGDVAMLYRGNSVTWQPPPFDDEIYDMIVDDGSHRPRDQAATFTNLWPLVAPGGRYFIEDVYSFPSSRPSMPKWFADRAEHFNPSAFAELLIALQDSGGEVIFHDFTDRHKPDSFLIEVRKP